MSGRLAPLGALVLLVAGGAVQAQGKRNGAILPGGDAKQPINIEAGKLDYFDKEQKLIYTGNVIAVQGTSKLKSSVLTIFLAPKTPVKDGQAGGGSNQVQHMIAAGPVTMVQKDQVGTGDNADYDKPANILVLAGNVVLTQGPNITKGDKLVYDLKTGHATVTGARVVGMFETGGDTAAKSGEPAGGDKENAPPRRGGHKSTSR